MIVPPRMSDSTSSSAPSSSGLGAVIDLGFRTAYKVAHRMLRAYWSVRKPSTHGALVAVWHDGKLLLVKNSYRRHYTLPGGYVRPSETASQAAQRELLEEVRLRVPLERLREVVWAGFESPQQVLRRPIVPHLEEYLREREASR